MSIKIKARQGFKAIVRCSNPMELQWWLQIQANMRNPEGKINPLVSVQGLDGKEIPSTMPRHESRMLASGELVRQGDGSVKIVPDKEAKTEPSTLPVEIIKPTPIEGTPISYCGETVLVGKKDDKTSTSVDEGKTG